MRSDKRVLLVLLCVLFLAVATNAAAATTTVVRGDLGRRIDRFLTNLSGFGFSGSMLVVQRGKVVLRKGYGQANEAAKIAITPDTLFDIGSLAKPFTAIAILQLETQGKLKITDTIGTYLPDVPEDKRAITIEQLLSHTAGLDSDFPLKDPYGEYYEEVDRDDAVRRILAAPLIGEPGQAYSYSNPGFVLLAAIVEIASGQPYRDYLRVHIFQPAGMRETGFWGNGLPAVADARIAHSYDETHETGDPRKWSSTTWVDLGGGEIVSTLGDLYKWSLALRGETLLPRAAKEKMFTPRIDEHGLAWFLHKTPRGTTLIEHGGDYAGFGSQFSWFRDEDTLLIELANRSNQIFGTRHVADRIVPQIIFGEKELHMFAGDAFELPPASTSIAPALAAKLAGTYRLSSGGKLTIESSERGVEIGADGQDAVDALAAAPPAELERRARLNERARTILSGFARGDASVLRAEWLRPGATVEMYTRIFRNVLADAVKETGALRSVEIAGTAPGAFPVGVLHTKVRLIGEKGPYEFQLNWVNERIIGISETPALLARTPLRAGSKSLVAWSIIWFKGFDVRYESGAIEILKDGKGTRACMDCGAKAAAVHT